MANKKDGDDPETPDRKDDGDTDTHEHRSVPAEDPRTAGGCRAIEAVCRNSTIR